MADLMADLMAESKVAEKAVLLAAASGLTMAGWTDHLKVVGMAGKTVVGMVAAMVAL